MSIVQMPTKEKANTNNTELRDTIKSKIAALPQFRGEVFSKNNIRSLPKVAEGEIFWVENDNAAYVVSKVDGKKVSLSKIDENMSISTGITIYELNKSIVSKEPTLDLSDLAVIKSLTKAIGDFCAAKNNDFYILLNREIGYFTLFRKVNEVIDESAVIQSLGNIGDVISCDRNEDGTALEIWIRTAKHKASVMYFIPFDACLVDF